LFSSCAAGLPDGFQEWNLSGMTIQGGKRVRPQEVRAWLEVVYESIAPHESSVFKHDTSFNDLVNFLYFADAVGSSDQLMMAAVRRLPGLNLQVQIKDSRVIFDVCGSRRYTLVQYGLSTCTITATSTEDISKTVANALPEGESHHAIAFAFDLSHVSFVFDPFHTSKFVAMHHSSSLP
jgi:hypothetical protein